MSEFQLRRRLRASWRDVLIGVICVLIAGFIATWTKREDYYAEVHGGVNQTMEVSASGQTLTVVRVDGSSSLRRSAGSQVLTSKDRFIQVRLRLATPGDQIERKLNCWIRQGDAEVRPIFATDAALPAPGFVRTVDLAFERPVDGLEGAVLACQPSETIVAWSRELVIDLAIDRATSDEWTAPGRKPLLLDATGDPEVLR